MIEALPGHHPFKPGCLFELSRLFESAGNPEEQKPLLVHALTIERSRGDDRAIALALRELRLLSSLTNLLRESTRMHINSKLRNRDCIDTDAGGKCTPSCFTLSVVNL